MTQTQAEASADTDIAPDVRTRTYSWSDPAAALSDVMGRSGLEVLQAMAAGELPFPPITATLDFASFDVEEGRVVVTLQPQEFHYNPIGSVHGGVVATLLDTAAACAVHSTLPAGTAYTSLDLTTKFVRPMTIDSGLVRCEGRVVHKGSRMALAEASLTDQGGRLLATATSSCMIFGG